MFASFQMRLHLLLGDVEAAWKWACGESLTVDWLPDDLPIGLREFQDTLRARVYLAKNQPSDVLALYERVSATALPGGRMAWVLELGLYKALALQMLGDKPGALKALAKCLSLAAPEGYKRVFLETGAPAVALLQQAASHSVYSEYAGELLAAFNLPTQASIDIPPLTTTPIKPLVEPLSPREIEVLDLICNGYTNQEIADTLVVSLNTVKKHTSHIYGKLGVKNRAQAIAQARELGLER